MKNSYGVIHKTTKQWFCGFDSNDQIIWGAKDQAKGMDYHGAKAQAALFVCNDIKAQQKPVLV